jgi:hypothetical protein
VEADLVQWQTALAEELKNAKTQAGDQAGARGFTVLLALTLILTLTLTLTLTPTPTPTLTPTLNPIPNQVLLKKNGRVGTRRLGTPDWQNLAGDVASRGAAGLDITNI